MQNSFLVPGKVMIAGEWSVLEKGHAAVVAGVPVSLSISVSDSENFIISSELFGEVSFSFDSDELIRKNYFGEEGDILYAQTALEFVLRFLHEKNVAIQPCKLDILSKKDFSGLGSSAVVTVLVVRAVLEQHGFVFDSFEDKLLLFKLCSLAHFSAQGYKGSSFDVAASVFGGVFLYVAPDIKWLKRVLQEGVSILEVVDGEWDYLKIEPIRLLKSLHLLICYVGYSASSVKFMEKVAQIRLNHDNQYVKILKKIDEVVLKIANSLQNGDEEEFIAGVQENRRLLQNFSNFLGLELETKELAHVAEIAEKHGVAGKFSGAGGGDIAIVLSFDNNLDKVQKECEKSGYIVKNVVID